MDPTQDKKLELRTGRSAGASSSARQPPRSRSWRRRSLPIPGKDRVVFLVDAHTLSAEDAGGSKKMNVSLYASIYDSSGKNLGTRSTNVDKTFDAATYQQILDKGMMVPIDMEIPAGAREFRLAVLDNKTGFIGTASGPLGQVKLTKQRKQEKGRPKFGRPFVLVLQLTPARELTLSCLRLRLGSRRRASACACASASSMALRFSSARLARISARFWRFSSSTCSLPSSSMNAFSAPSPLRQAVRTMRSIAALAVAKARSHGIEKLVDGFVCHQVGGRLPTRREIALLAERDHLLDLRTHRLRLDRGRLNALFHDDRGHHVAQHGAPVRSGSSEFVSCNFVTHGLPQ